MRSKCVVLREQVLAVNKKHGVEMVVDAKMKEQVTAEEKGGEGSER